MTGISHHAKVPDRGQGMLVIRRHYAKPFSASFRYRQAGTALSAKSFGKSAGAASPQDAERAWFAGLLWRAFPEARSENDLAELAAEILTSDDRPVTSRTVRNWLRQENSPHFRYVLRVIALVGAESIFQIIDPEHRP